MHEYSLVEALVTRVEEEARKRNALAVHKLSVRVGELSGVDPELFQTAYETFRAGTIRADVPSPSPASRRAGPARAARRPSRAARSCAAPRATRLASSTTAPTR